jgi:uncharacterized membrane protein YdbT with pleckstrin-like domain
MAKIDAMTLIPGEHVLRRIRPHWIILVVPGLAAIILTIPYGYLLASALHLDAPFSTILGWALSLTYVFLLSRWSLRGIVAWFTTTYLFTDQRIVTRTGLLKISGESIALNRVHSIQFEKTLLERLLGSGSLTIESAAANDIRIRHVTHVEEVQRELYEQIHYAEDPSSERINFSAQNDNGLHNI